jgi:hypothetical protein
MKRPQELTEERVDKLPPYLRSYLLRLERRIETLEADPRIADTYYHREDTDKVPIVSRLLYDDRLGEQDLGDAHIRFRPTEDRPDWEYIDTRVREGGIRITGSHEIQVRPHAANALLIKLTR